MSTQLEDPWPLLPLQNLLEGGMGDIQSAVREDDQWERLEMLEAGGRSFRAPAGAAPCTPDGCIGGAGSSDSVELNIVVDDE